MDYTIGGKLTKFICKSKIKDISQRRGHIITVLKITLKCGLNVDVFSAKRRSLAPQIITKRPVKQIHSIDIIEIYLKTGRCCLAGRMRAALSRRQGDCLFVTHEKLKQLTEAEPREPPGTEGQGQRQRQRQRDGSTR